MSKTRMLLGGLKSLLPWRAQYTMSPNPIDVRYGYAVWLRHVAALSTLGFRGPFPTVVELGPGNSVATGICAILSGSKRYIGLDVIRHVAQSGGRTALEALEALFDERVSIPDASAYPHLRPALERYDFPSSAARTVDARDDGDDRTGALRRDLDAIAAGADGGDTLRYIVPWNARSIEANSVDLVFSQAVLQEMAHTASHSALRQTIEATARWLRPGGLASHQIDFGFYGMEPWNIHWTWSTWSWKVLRGRRDNFVNREPLSTYVSLMNDCGLTVVSIAPDVALGAGDSDLSPRFRNLPEAERRTRAAHIVVRKDA